MPGGDPAERCAAVEPAEPVTERGPRAAHREHRLHVVARHEAAREERQSLAAENDAVDVEEDN